MPGTRAGPRSPRRRRRVGPRRPRRPASSSPSRSGCAPRTGRRSARAAVDVVVDGHRDALDLDPGSSAGGRRCAHAVLRVDAPALCVGGPVAQAVERDRRGCARSARGSAPGIFAIPPTIWMMSQRSVSARTTSRLLGAFEQRLAGGEERGAAGLEERGVSVEILEQLVGERLLGDQVAREPVHPGYECVPRREAPRTRPRSGRGSRPRRRTRPRAGPGGSGSCGTACRSRPRPGARSPPARSRRRAPRTPRGQPRRPCRSCGARRRASAGA